MKIRLFFYSILFWVFAGVKVFALTDTILVNNELEVIVLYQSATDSSKEVVLVNKDSFDLHLQLEIINPYLSTKLQSKPYILNAKKKKSVLLDSLIVLDEIPTNRNHLYSIVVPKLSVFPLKIQLENPFPVPQSYSLILWDKDKRTSIGKREDISLAIFFTINFFFLLIFGLHIFISKLYGLWTFFVYVLLGIAFVSLDLGISFWNDFLSIREKGIFVLLISNLYLISGITFVNFLFESYKKHKNSYLFLSLISVLLGLLVVGYGLIWVLHLALPLWLIMLNFTMLIIGTISVFYIAILHTVFEKERGESFWFMMGFLLHGGSVVVLLLELVGMLNKNFLTLLFPEWIRNSLLTFHTSPVLLVGMILEVGIVFVIMVYRVKWLYEKNIRMLNIIALKKERNVNDFVLGIESERKRIAQDIHDSIGVQLSAIKMKLSLLNNQTEETQKIISDLDSTSNEVRQITHNLISPTLERLGLEFALQELFTKVQQTHNLKVTWFKNIDLESQKPELKINLLRIIQELLNNVIKHSKAKEVSVQFLKSENGILVTFEDDGIGFDPNNKVNSGIGLSSIKNRIALLDGQIIVESSADSGTYISIEIPLYQS